MKNNNKNKKIIIILLLLLLTTGCTKTLTDDNNILNELEAIPTYKVCELLSKYKKNRTFYRIIKKELINRGIYQNKIHKINKEIDSLRESDDDDKYKRRRKIKCKKS